jgi:hypothetical protein
MFIPFLLGCTPLFFYFKKRLINPLIKLQETIFTLKITKKWP